MNRVGLLFPGQGSQFSGMGQSLYHQIPSAKKIMDQSNEVLGFNIQSIIFEGTDEEIVQTQIAQPAIYIISAMYFEKFKLMNEGFEIVAGHSLGEYSALYAAGVLSFQDGLNLVKTRGHVMSQVNKIGTMYAIMSVPLDVIQQHVVRFENRVVIANINSKTQVVISGYTQETRLVAEQLSQIDGSKVKELNVSSAFHSPIMAEAQDLMANEIKDVKFNTPGSAVIPNVLGYATKDPVIIQKSLIEQITGRVKWMDTIMNMKNNGINQLYEVGPGEVLKKLNQTITLRPKCSGLD